MNKIEANPRNTLIKTLFEFFSLKKWYRPIAEITGMQNSRIIWIEDTALNLLYSGTKSMKRFVMKEKFLPQDNTKDKIEPSIRE